MTSSTILVLTPANVNYNYILIIVKTGAPSMAPSASLETKSSGGSNSQDMTPIIIGAAVGGVALLVILLAAYFYCGGGKHAPKIEPR